MSNRRSKSAALSDFSSDSTGVERLASSLKRYDQSSSLTWLVPLLITVGVGLLIYLIYNYSCGSSSHSDTSNSNGVLIVSNMTNNNTNGGQVIDLDGDKLEALSSNQPIVVAFLAQGCGWCSKVKPNYVEAAKNSPKTLYSLYAHSKNGMDRCKQYGVKGFPTILYIHKGRVVAEYSGDRSPADLVRWVKSLQ